MAKFLTGSELNLEIEKLFERADEQLILISPFIRLHDRMISTLKTKLKTPSLKITIVFGKNEDDIAKSMKLEDFNFFKEFPNIEIRYEKRLHAKYYANESSAIMTSMNLHRFSQDNNIEAGVMTKATLLGNLNNLVTNLITDEDSYDNQAWTYFKRVIEQADLLYKKTPNYENILLGLNKKYIGSKVEKDILTEFFLENSSKEITKKIEPSIVSNIKNIQVIKDDEKYISTTALSKELKIESKALFAILEQKKLMIKKDKSWILTAEGQNLGGVVKQGQYGEYVAWPKSIQSILI